MKTVSVREFRDHATEYLRSQEPVLVLRGSQPAGVFVPWDDTLVPSSIVQRLAYERLTAALQDELAAQGVSWEEVLRDFEADRRHRR